MPESDDEEQVWVGKEEGHGQREGSHTPATRKSLPKATTSRRKSRNRTSELSQSRDHIDESPSEENHKTPDRVDHTDHKNPELISPLRKASLCEQKMETCQNIHENVSMNMSILPLTPKPSPSPEPVPQNVTAFSEFLDPLHGQITSSEYSDSKGDQIKPENLPEKPIDIVLKSRSMVIPIKEETSPKPRIVITYLTLTNFKSYAGRQEVGPFHTSFSSVVGPNGSGKSNVIDSLLFVFGFRASKMRQGKISALIHNSAEHPNLDHCEVTVHFQEVLDQPNGTPVILSNSDLIISRRAFKNNSSKYYLNGNESSFTAVTTLLRDRGIDLDHKRFLILQGEVESIAQMKPKAANEHDDGLLEYLEDIIGTSKYKIPIEESATQVETLNEVCAEKNGRVQHVEKEKKQFGR